MRYGIKELFFNILKSIKSFTVSAYLMGSSKSKPLLKKLICQSIRPLFGGSQLFYTRATSYIFHHGLLCGKSPFTAFKPFGPVLLEKGGFSTLSAIRASRMESDGGIVNRDNLINFYEWFSGFTDAEGAFYIVTGKSCAFRFQINLHKQDVDALHFIQKYLGFGEVRTYNNFSAFTVTKIKDIAQLLEIFTLYPLQGSKWLNFMDFSKAYALYTKGDKGADTLKEILKIKEGMNRSRLDFTMLKDTNITAYWLLGFVEGEGCFSINRGNSYRLDFSICQSYSNVELMKKIKLYLENLPNTNGNYAGAIGISTVISKNPSHQSVIRIETTRIPYIADIFIPFLDSLNWHSKKQLDFQDWKNILLLREQGKLPPYKETSPRISSRKKAIARRTVDKVNFWFPKPYSTLTNINNERFRFQNEGKFIEWFVGLTDGEGSFGFIKRKSRNSYIFRFRISLHLDDIAVLYYIKAKLGLGRVSKEGDWGCVYSIDRVEEIKEILEIFSKRPLNTTKHLNFLKFKEAFFLYVSSELDDHLHIKLENLRNEMNSNRKDFELPHGHSYLITPNWLLGFTEGEGSFSISKESLSLSFTLTQAHTDVGLMEKICQFFNNLPDSMSRACADIKKFGEVAKTYTSKKSISDKSYCDLKINNSNYIKEILIPFFDSLEWHSKKELDYKDWKTVLKVKDLGQHYTEEGLELIGKILSQINNNRLSSSNSTKVNRVELDADIVRFLSDPNKNNYEIREGKVWIKSLNRFQSSWKSNSVQLWDREGNLLETFSSMKSMSTSLGLNRTTLLYRLKNNVTFEYKGKKVLLKSS